MSPGRRLFPAPTLPRWMSRPRIVLLAVMVVSFCAASAQEPGVASSTQWTQDERAWLDRHPVITFGVNQFPPLIFSTRAGSATGIGPQYVSLIARRAGLQVRWITYRSWSEELNALKRGELDVAPTMASSQTPPGLIASRPWMFLKGVIVTRRTASRIAGVEDLENQVIAAERFTPGEMVIRRRLPRQSLLVTESVPEMLDAVVHGRADAAVGMLAIVDYAIRNGGYGNSLKLAAPFGDQDVPVRMAVRNDSQILLRILDEAIATATDEERQQILEHWFVPTIERGLDPKRVRQLAISIGLPVLALGAFVLYWVLRLRREVRWRKEAQQRIVDITDSVPGVVFEFIRAPDGSYCAPFVSGAIEELVGLTPDAVIENVNCYFEQVVPEDIGDYRAAIEKSAAEGCEVRHSFRIRHAGTGELRWLAAHALAPRHAGGYTNWRGHVVDITEQKRLERDIELALERAESAQRAKGEFLANMSHEIRTPMNAVIGMSHLLLQGGLSTRQLNYVTKIDAAARSLLGIINDALDVSKIEAGKLTLESTPFRLQAVLDNLTTMVGQRAHEKGLELVFDVDPAIPGELIGDAMRLGQILINLCSNAVKFTNAGEIVVRAHLLETSEVYCLLRFEVTDTGIGISPDQMSRLFQPFEQATVSTTRQYGGTGLGLTIAKRLSEMMGGTIGAESQPGRGSTFWFTVRLPAGQISAPVSTSAIEGMRMLIADDNAAVRTAQLSIATSLKLNAVAASSAEEAMVRLREAQPRYHIVLIDWRMRGSSSNTELIRTIRAEADARGSPFVILATAYDGDEPLHALRGIRIDGLLMKPVSAPALLAAIERAIGYSVAMPFPSAPLIPDENSPNLMGRRILIVEDNEINREVAKDLLARTGASIVLAANGKEAVTIASREPFDCVLMDIQMPVMDGVEATRALRSNPALRELPIIATTANAMAGDRDRFINAGMNDHLAKPIQPSELYAALSHWIKAGEADMRQGLARVNGNARLYFRLLRKFRENHADVILRIRSALARGDRSTAGREAHTIMGVSATLGAGGLSAAARAVEAACRTDVPATAIDLTAMDRALGRLLAQIDHTLLQQEPVSVPAAPERPQIAILLERLKQAIEGHEGTAAETLNRLQLILGNDSRLRELEKHLDRYDFPAAGPVLDTLMRDLKEEFSGAT